MSSFGVSATAAQLNQCSGARANLQTQLDDLGEDLSLLTTSVNGMIKSTTVTGSTSDSGNVSLGIGAGYHVISIKCTSQSVVTHAFFNTGNSTWYAHVTNSSTNANVTGTSVTLSVLYI